MIKDIIIHNTGTGGGAIGAEAVLGRGSIPACAGGLGGGRKRRLAT